MAKKTQTKRSIALNSIVGIFVVSTLILPTATVWAQSASQLRSQSASLDKKIENNQAQANELNKEGDTLQAAINELDHEIAEGERQISATKAKLKQLAEDLKKTQAELERQKNLLEANMLALYKRGDASAVEMIAGSDSFSAYIDEQEYLERIKDGITVSAQKVQELEAKIKSQREEQKENLEKQKAAQDTLNDLRSRRANLLAQTRGKESQYKKIVAGLKEKRAAIDQQLANLIASQQFSNYGTVGEGGGFIGRVGSTGFSTGPHLHFEMRNSSGQVFNPRNAMGIWPSAGPVTQDFGNPSSWYANGFHPGIDIGSPFGAPVYATKPGTIVFRGWDGAYGNMVMIRHSDGNFSVYGHLSSF